MKNILSLENLKVCIDDKKILKKAIYTIQKHSLDKPFPLRYTHEDNTQVNMKSVAFFAKDYERHVVWTHMGPLFIDIVGKASKQIQKQYLIEYRDMILKYKNFLEVFFPDGSPYRTAFYYSDESMSWCANYLMLCKDVGIKN